MSTPPSQLSNKLDPASSVNGEDKKPEVPQNGITPKTEQKSSLENSEHTTKRKRIKRTSEQILQELKKQEAKVEEAQKKEEAPPTPPAPPKKKAKLEEKVKVVYTDEDDEDEEQPSFFRGAAKHLLLASLAVGTFAVNHFFKTTVKKVPVPVPVPPPPPAEKYFQPEEVKRAPPQQQLFRARPAAVASEMVSVLPKIAGFM